MGGPFGSDLTTRDYVESGVPVIRGGNLNADHLFYDDEFVFVSEQKAERLSANTAVPGDLIFTQRGTLGQVGLIPEDAKYGRYLISQSQMKLTVNPDIVDARFVYYFFRLPETVQEVKNRAITSGVPHINLGILRGFSIPLPPLDCQKAITAILATYDDLIENNRRRMALLEEAARKLYREWFICLRFPGHEHTPIRNGLPEGWERKTLGDVAEINRANLPKGFDAEIEYIDISAVTPGRINKTTRYQFSDAPSRARRVVQHGDILWSCVRPNRKSYGVVWNPCENLIASTGFAVITPDGVPSSFLEQATTTDDFVRYLENNAKGAAYPAVLASDFERAEVLIPPKPLLKSFAAFAEPLLAQRHNLETQTRKLRTARDRLLPKLMSGEIEV